MNDDVARPRRRLLLLPPRAGVLPVGLQGQETGAWSQLLPRRPRTLPRAGADWGLAEGCGRNSADRFGPFGRRFGDGAFERIEVVTVGCDEGVVKEVYEIESWHPAGTTNYTTRSDVDVAGRWEFLGNVAPPEVRETYLDHNVRGEFRRGAQSPVKYVNC